MKHVPLKVRLSRVCEFIRGKGDKFLHVTLSPKTKSIEFQWGGEGPIKSIPIIDLVRTKAGEAPKSSAPKDWGTWVRVEDLKSEVAISPGLTPQERGHLMSAVDRIALHREWMEMKERPSWESFLEEKGRKDLHH